MRPSARPRNSEYVPSVTISGETFSRAMSDPFSKPPVMPIDNAAPAAAGIGQCASCQSAPKLTAQSPIMDPTERSMPPVMITGVSASVRSPISTPSRMHSKKLVTEKKLGAARLSSRTSTSSRLPTNTSCLAAFIGRLRVRRRLPRGAGGQGVKEHSQQNDRALDGLLPISAQS